MALAIRIVLILALIFTITDALCAQETTTAAAGTAAVESTTTETAGETVTATADKPPAAPTRWEVRNQFVRLLQQSPIELQTILALDPALIMNESFMARHPEVAQFVAQHPEIARNPAFYVADFAYLRDRDSIVEDLMEPLLIFASFLLVAFALGWLVRTIIEQKRWNRLSKTQAEVHTKLLDRFGTSEELLAYIRTPAGSKFLESAPIPVRTEQAVTPTQKPSLTRVMWSVQIGVLIAAAAIGILLVSLRLRADSGEGLFALGAIALSVGFGFIASAAVSLFLSRRLGLWEPPQSGDTTPAEKFRDPGLVK